MWEHVGLERNATGLGAASARLAAWRAPEVRDRRTAEDRNLLDLARLTVAAALARTGSVGAHFRSDDPTTPAPHSERRGRRAPLTPAATPERGSLMTDRREIDRIVTAALDEDAPWGDLTSETLIPEDATAVAELVAREAGVLSGIEVFAAAFRLVDPRIAFEPLAADGDAFEAGAVLARVQGPARGILTAERVGLNLVQRMSGVATLTARYVAAVAGTARAHRRHPQDDARACAASSARPCATAAGATTGARSPTP